MILPKHSWILLLLISGVTCNDRLGSGLRSDATCRQPQKIVVYKENVYDLNGYQDEGHGDPFALFDENGSVDPANDPNAAYKPQTNPQPTWQPAIYFPAGKGNRIVVDLQTMHHLTDVYLYDRSNSADSVWIYTGNMLHWKQRAAFTSFSFFNSSRWRKFPLDDSSQYVMIRFNGPKTTITEMVFYGCADGIAPPPPGRPVTDSVFARKTMKEFLGVNDYSGIIDTKWLKPFYYTRLYSFAVDFDKDTIHAYPEVQYNMMHFGVWDGSRRDYYYWPEDNVKQNRHRVWYTMQGLPLWMAKNELDKKNRPVTHWGMDPEDPMSYARHGAMMWNLAAWFGAGKIDTQLLSLDHQPKLAGRGTMQLYENGNEEDGFWAGERYSNPMDYFAQSTADYDGAEGTLGHRCGIFNADSSSRLITSGMVELDTNRVRVYKFLCSTLRKDKAFIWKGGIQYHHYSTNGKHGITPEEDSLRWRLTKAATATHTMVPGVPCILGENGYDKNQHTRQSTPLLPGISTEESQAVFILRSINATAFSGFDAYILYWLRDGVSIDDPSLYLTSGAVREMPDKTIQPYPSWFYVSAFESRLADYRPVAIVSETGPAWIYKYRNERSPDSVAYFVYSPTHNGSHVPAFGLKVGALAGGEAAEIDFTANSSEGILKIRKVVDGVVTIAVDEKPKLIMVKERLAPQ
jgi:hypothetical protein